MWAFAFRQERHQAIDLPPGSGTWSLSVARGAHLRDLFRDLHQLVGLRKGIAAELLEVHGSWPRGAVGDLARRLGVTYLRKIPAGAEDVAYYFMPGSGGAVPTDPDGVVLWLEQVLGDDRYQDTTEKLLALEADERHVFLMTRSATEFGVDELLRRADTRLPSRRPSLKPGISHAWCIPRYGGTGCVLRSDDRWCFIPVPVLEEEQS